MVKSALILPPITNAKREYNIKVKNFLAENIIPDIVSKDKLVIFNGENTA